MEPRLSPAEEFARSGGRMLGQGSWQCPEVGCCLGSTPVPLGSVYNSALIGGMGCRGWDRQAAGTSTKPLCHKDGVRDPPTPKQNQSDPAPGKA